MDRKKHIKVEERSFDYFETYGIRIVLPLSKNKSPWLIINLDSLE